jgi:site-specific DNA recombinase
VIACYLRESTDKQDIRTQRKLAQEECARRDIEYQEFADDGITGMIPFRKRPKGGVLWEAAKSGALQEIIVYRFDRLGRDQPDTALTIRELFKLGVKIRSLKEGLAENTASGRLKTNVHTVFAEYERELLIERSVDLALVEEEAVVLRRIYKNALAGCSCVWIAADLNKRHVPTVYMRDKRTVLGKNTAGIWTSTRVRNLIINPLHKGVLIYGKRKNVRGENGKPYLKIVPREQWICVPCPELAIVSEKDWDRACGAVHDKQLAAMAHPQYSYLLRGLVRCSCGLCYYGMTSTRQPSGRKVTYYMHSRRSPRERCTSKALLGDQLEALVWDRIASYLHEPGAVIKELANKMEAEGHKGQKVKDEIRRLESKRDSLVFRRNRAQDFLTDGTLNRAEYDRQIRRITEDSARIEQELAELRGVAVEQDANAQALDKARSVLESWQKKARGKLTFEKRRAIVESLVDGIRIKPGEKEIQTTFRFDFERGSSDLTSDYAVT